MANDGAIVDWEVAAGTARRLVRPGPEITREEADAAVAELRGGVAVARDHVAEFTGLPAGAEDGVLIVDRPGWAQANLDLFRVLIAPLADKMWERREGVPPQGAMQVLGGLPPKVAGVEIGALIAWLSGKVLGQYDAFGSDGDGRLLLVAPNIVSVERELRVDPADFRLWVCLHEQTHRTQFTAVPWLRDHLRDEIQAFLLATDLDPGAFANRIREALGTAMANRRDPGSGESAPDRGTPSEGPSFSSLVQTPEQRRILERLVAVMSLLEGHADYVMDGVGPEVIGSVAEIRAKFTKRRSRGQGRLDAVLRRVLGLDAKMRQYRDGERFVRKVVEEVGMAGFNRVWTSPNTLPTRPEIADPDAWVRRIFNGR